MDTTAGNTEDEPLALRSDGRDSTILVVDDETSIRRIIDLELSAQGFRVQTANGGEEALRILERQRPDLVILDLLMPGVDGWQVLSVLDDRKVPVIILTAKDNEADRIRGLDMGADDYITKPFSPEELSARVRAVLRRLGRKTIEGNVVRSGDIEIDLDRRLVKKAGRQVSLSRTEWRLLQHLAEYAGKVIPSGEILSRVWGGEYVNDVHYLRLWVSRLRHKLEDNPGQPKVVVTRPGVGYQLNLRPEALEEKRAG